MDGFEDRTTEWFRVHASERAGSLATSAEEEKQQQEEGTILKGTTIDDSKTRLLDLLCNYADGI